jgi:hypothetical protein
MIRFRNPAPLPTRALRLKSGNIIISDQFSDRVISIDPQRNIVATNGNIKSPRYVVDNTSQGSFAPCDAKVVGDYTGITTPRDDD